MQRLIITGANGAGKSHLAAELSAMRPEVPVVSFDALKLKRNWQQRPRDEIHRALRPVVQGPCWLLEGGPSLLPVALEFADGVVWLDPHITLRAWRLLVRPWRYRGATRPELPAGNVDWPLQQYRFAWRSLRKDAKFRSVLSSALAREKGPKVWHCRNEAQLAQVRQAWMSGQR